MAQLTPVTNQIPIKVGGSSLSELTDLESEVNQLVQKLLANANSSSGEAIKDATRLGEIASMALQQCKGNRLSQEWLLQPILNCDRANLICSNTPVASSGYWGEQKPFMGYYAQGKSYYRAQSLITVRFHPAQFVNFPESVQRAIGDTSGKKVDYFLLADSSCGLKEKRLHNDHPWVLNISMHSWAQPHYDGKDCTEMVSLGVYEPLGVYPIRTDEGISFHQQKELPVICHPKQIEGEWAHAISPDNVHIGVDENTNFSSFWLVAKLRERVLVAKYILSNDMTGETSAAIWKAFNDSSSIGEFLKALKQVPTAILQPFLEIADCYENEDLGGATRTFNHLAQVFKNYVYHKTWDILWKNKSVQPPHPDFGQAAFHSFEDLDQQYHCSAKQKAAIVRSAGTEFQEEHELLSNELTALFSPPKFIPPVSEEQRAKEKLLTPIAEAFERNETEKAFQLFNGLEQSHKHRIYQYVWESFECPRTFAGDFGEASFHANPALQDKHHCDNVERARMILCYLHSI